MFRAGAAAGLESFRDPSLLLNAFGADAPTFVRVVPVEGPAPLQVALAPLGEAWEVIGVMQADRLAGRPATTGVRAPWNEGGRSAGGTDVPAPLAV